jgi:hypothetical protein
MGLPSSALQLPTLVTRRPEVGVKVVDFKRDGNARIVVHDQRLPGGRLRKYVGRDWKAANLAASHIRIKLAANDLSFLTATGRRPSSWRFSKRSKRISASASRSALWTRPRITTTNAC